MKIGLTCSVGGAVLLAGLKLLGVYHGTWLAVLLPMVLFLLIGALRSMLMALGAVLLLLVGYLWYTGQLAGVVAALNIDASKMLAFKW